MMVRALWLIVPLVILSYLFMSPRLRLTVREITACFMGFNWAFLSFLLLNIVLLQHSVWQTSIQDSLLYGVPLDWVLSYAVIIGVLLPLLRLTQLHLIFRFVLQGIFTVVLYDAVATSLSGVALLVILLATILISVLPATFLFDWTAETRSIRSRSFLQSLVWVVYLLWLFPAIVFNLTSDSWMVLLQRDVMSLCWYLLPMLLPVGLLVSALTQFAVEGNGTAFPYDAPQRLVIGGVYRYISNPMQLGVCLLMGWWGILLGSIWIVFSAVVAVILFIVFKDVCNGSSALGQNNTQWQAYQAAVPKWWPRFTAYKRSIC